jgi:hypothetical protein
MKANCWTQICCCLPAVITVFHTFCHVKQQMNLNTINTYLLFAWSFALNNLSNLQPSAWDCQIDSRKCPCNFLALFSTVCSWQVTGNTALSTLAVNCWMCLWTSLGFWCCSKGRRYNFDIFVFQAEAEAFESPHAATETPLKMHRAVRGIAAWRAKW